MLPVLLAEEPDTEAWTLPTALAWSGGTYLETRPHKCANGKEECTFCDPRVLVEFTVVSDVLEVSGAMQLQKQMTTCIHGH